MKKEMTSLQKATLIIQQLQRKLDQSETAGKEPIAVIGMACRFPGCRNLDEFWDLLDAGGSGICEIPADRWDCERYYSSEPEPGKMYTRYGGFVDDIHLFDAKFFGLIDLEAKNMDPQQKLVLETAWQALYHAGYAAEHKRKTDTGVYIGIATNDFTQLVKQNTSFEYLDPYYITGNSLSAVAGRLGHILGLMGPGMIVDTACSSSLVAVHLACRALQNGECSQALAGGVNLILTPDNTIAACSGGMLSGDNTCRSFDAGAEGYVRSEGCGIVLLKRLSVAIEDGDYIHAVIRGSAVNQSGCRASFSAPNGLAQQQLIRSALEDACLSAAQIDYVETHGSATKIGDPIEINALGAVFAGTRGKGTELIVGSVKTNLGHMESAAGVGGLLKVILSMQHQSIPAHINFDTPSPFIHWDKQKIVISSGKMEWPGKNFPGYAGVSSFGITGINTHMILENRPGPEEPRQQANSIYRVITMSAHSPAALEEYTTNLEKYFSRHVAFGFNSIVYTLNTYGVHGPCRSALIATSLEQALDNIRERKKGFVAPSFSSPGPGKIVFFFTGQGALYADVGKSLYETNTVFRNELERCGEHLKPLLDRPLTEILFSGEISEELLKQPQYAQPALFALEYSLARFWQALGVEPDVLIGHSLGEYVAACIGGVFSLADALRLLVCRAKCVQTMAAAGTMVTVFAGEQEVSKLIEPFGKQLSLAIINGPAQVVVSGAKEALDSLMAALKAKKIIALKLPFSYPFHSALLEEVLDSFYQVAEKISYKAPHTEIISNLTGAPADEVFAGPEYWGRHLVGTVRFYDSLVYLERLGRGIFLEIGPNPILLALSKELFAGNERCWLASLQQGDDSMSMIARSLAQLYVDGVDIRWDVLDNDSAVQKVPLPLYAFEKKYSFFIPRSRLGQWDPDYPRYSVAAQGRDVAAFPGEAAPGGLYTVRWEPENQVAADTLPVAENKKTFWILLHEEQIEDALLRNFAGKEYLLVSAGDAYHFSPEKKRVIIRPLEPADYTAALSDVAKIYGGEIAFAYLWSLSSPLDNDFIYSSFCREQSAGCFGLLNLVKALQELPESLVLKELAVVTRATSPVTEGDRLLDLMHAPLHALSGVIRMEHPELNCRSYDLSVELTGKDFDNLTARLFSGAGGLRQAHRCGKWFRPRLSNLIIGKKQDLKFHANATYIITGGLGGLGLQLTDWLISQGARNLALMGRNCSPGEREKRKFAEYNTRGISIKLYKADVSVPGDLYKAFKSIKKELPPLKGIFHAAGLLDDGIIINQTPERFEKLFRAKVAGSLHLHRISREIPLDYFVLFSSVASVFGSPGQANYAAANGFEDALAQHRKALGLPALSINWGPWEKRGMARANPALENYFHKAGFIPFNPGRGFKLLGAALEVADGGAIAMDVDWERFDSRFNNLEPGFFSSFLNSASEEQPLEQKKKMLEKLAVCTGEEREALLRGYLRESLEEMLGVELTTAQCSQPLNKLGLDSLIAIQIRNRIKRELRINFDIVTLMAESSLLTLAGDLNRVMDKEPLVKSEETVKQILTVDDAQDLLQDLDSLSEDEIDRLIAEDSNANGSGYTF